MRVLSTVLHYK